MRREHRISPAVVHPPGPKPRARLPSDAAARRSPIFPRHRHRPELQDSAFAMPWMQE
jgi:hypothetical protein